MSNPRALVVNLTRLGDLLQTGPLLRALRRSQPAAQITMLVLESFVDAARRLPEVDHVVGFDLDRFVGALDARRGRQAQAVRLLAELIEDRHLEQPRIVVNLSHTERSATLCGALRPARSYGLIRTGHAAAHCVDPWSLYALSIIRERADNPLHLVDVYRQLLGCNTDKAGLSFGVSAAESTSANSLLRDVARIPVGARVVALIPGASQPERRWPIEYFGELSERLSRRGFRPVVIGSSSERELGQEIVRASRDTAASLCGHTDLGTLAALLNQCEVAIGNDTGPLHLATAVGTRVVGVYIGPAAAKDTGPYLDGAITLEADLAGTPCAYRARCGDCGCARAIPVDAVEAAVFRSSELTRLRGVRVWESRISPDAGCSLRVLNHPRTGYREEQLASDRAFWTRLLHPDAEGCACNPVRGVKLRPRPELFTALTDIAAQATRAITDPTAPWLPALQALERNGGLARAIASYFRVAWKCLPRDTSRAYLQAYELYVEALLRAAALLSGPRDIMPFRDPAEAEHV